jgi:hypothetical protein
VPVKTIPHMVDGELSAARFDDAIRYNGGGQRWLKDNIYDPLSAIDHMKVQDRSAISMRKTTSTLTGSFF